MTEAKQPAFVGLKLPNCPACGAPPSGHGEGPCVSADRDGVFAQLVSEETKRPQAVIQEPCDGWLPYDLGDDDFEGDAGFACSHCGLDLRIAARGTHV